MYHLARETTFASFGRRGQAKGQGQALRQGGRGKQRTLKAQTQRPAGRGETKGAGKPCAKEDEESRHSESANAAHTAAQQAGKRLRVRGASPSAAHARLAVTSRFPFESLAGLAGPEIENNLGPRSRTISARAREQSRSRFPLEGLAGLSEPARSQGPLSARARGTPSRYMIRCASQFLAQFSHVRVFSDLRNVQKRVTNSDTSGHCLGPDAPGPVPRARLGHGCGDSQKCSGAQNRAACALIGGNGRCVL